MNENLTYCYTCYKRTNPDKQKNVYMTTKNEEEI